METNQMLEMLDELAVKHQQACDALDLLIAKNASKRECATARGNKLECGVRIGRHMAECERLNIDVGVYAHRFTIYRNALWTAAS